jgi:hypothetical protein
MAATTRSLSNLPGKANERKWLEFTPPNLSGEWWDGQNK